MQVAVSVDRHRLFAARLKHRLGCLAGGEVAAVSYTHLITCQYGFVASGARKDRKFDSGLGGGALLDIGIYNLGFLRILTCLLYTSIWCCSV